MVSKQYRTVLKMISIYLTIFAGGFILMIPFFWMLSTALKGPVEVYAIPIRWIPDSPQWRNFVKAMTIMPFGRYLWNSALISLVNIVGTLLSCSLAGYSFARLRFRGKNLLFILVLSTMMLPGQVTMIPKFILFKSLGWLNTFMPLIVPSFFASGAFYIFLLRQFILGIPEELADSARIDGCSSFQIYLRLILPLAKPALIAVAIFVFMEHWNDFMGPLIYLSSENKWTASLALAAFRGGEGAEGMLNLMMAATIVVTAPCLVIFFLAQRYFIQGVTFTGLKG